ncbi:MAG: hypothetical protein QOE41_2706 [Mycobacterium sp.]|nr:hypothetical protein [Mycobacterium sp.]
MMWARGHKNDWDFFAAEAGDNGWSYACVGAEHLPSHRGLAWRPRPRLPRNRRPGFCPAAPRSQPHRTVLNVPETEYQVVDCRLIVAGRYPGSTAVARLQFLCAGP